MHRRQLLHSLWIAGLAGCGGGADAPAPAPAPSPPGSGYRGTLRTPAAPLARAEHVSTVMPDGSVLLLGGSGQESAPAQRVLGFDVAQERFVERGELLTGRFLHTATAVSAHQVLVVGGQRSVSGTPWAELLDLRTGLSAATAMPPVADRREHSATPLGGGQVLLIGGRRPGASPVLDTAELFDLATQRFTLLPARLLQARHGHSVLRLDAERLLVFGGRTLAGTPALPEYFHLPTQTFQAAAWPWIEPAPRSAAAAVRSFGGVSLFVGGVDGQDRPLAGAYRVRPGPPIDGAALPLAWPRARLAAAPLTDGRVLVTGGETDLDGGITASTELLDPATGISRPGPAMHMPRAGHSAELLPDGRVLIAGGTTASGAFATAVELFS